MFKYVILILLEMGSNKHNCILYSYDVALRKINALLAECVTYQNREVVADVVLKKVNLESQRT